MTPKGTHVRRITIRSTRLTAALAALVVLSAACQPTPTTPPPGEGVVRYRDTVFASSVRTNNITFGSAVAQNGSTVTLKMDLYEPANDGVQKRPAIVWVHGGGFQNGSKESTELVDQATVFARKGYVGVSINYRLSTGCFPVTVACIQSIIDAKHDAQAAVRYLRVHATELKIDPDRIAIAGTSAGAITALNVAYGADDVGSSGNPGPSSAVRAAVSLSGAALTTNPDAGEPPVLLFHGDADSVVPYSWATRTVDDAKTAKVTAYLTTFPGAGHVPFSQNRSTILTQTSNFLYWELDLTRAER